MDKYLVRAQFGRVQHKGGQVTTPYGVFETYEEALKQFNKVADRPMEYLGYKTVIIAERDPDGKYAKGLYGINAIYQVTITKE